MSYNLIVIGSGPGGYVAAIRASQLGMKVAIVEKESLGGICLNWGCIPTKALLKSAQVFDYVNHSENYGIKISKSSVDFDSIISRSRGVADGMSKGVNFLMKKNKIDILNGFGKIISKNEVEVTTEENKKEIHKSDNIIIATGGRSRELPNLKIDNKKVIEYRKAMTLKSMDGMFSIGLFLNGLLLLQQQSYQTEKKYPFFLILFCQNNQGDRKTLLHKQILS